MQRCKHFRAIRLHDQQQRRRRRRRRPYHTKTVAVMALCNHQTLLDARSVSMHTIATKKKPVIRALQLHFWHRKNKHAHTQIHRLHSHTVPIELWRLESKCFLGACIVQRALPTFQQINDLSVSRLVVFVVGAMAYGANMWTASTNSIDDEINSSNKLPINSNDAKINVSTIFSHSICQSIPFDARTNVKFTLKTASSVALIAHRFNRKSVSHRKWFIIFWASDGARREHRAHYLSNVNSKHQFYLDPPCLQRSDQCWCWCWVSTIVDRTEDK